MITNYNDGQSYTLTDYQSCGLRPSALGQNRSETNKKSGFRVLILYIVVLVLQVWCCVVKHGLVTLVVSHDDLEGHSNFSSTIYSFSILCLNITTVEINSGVYLLKS